MNSVETNPDILDARKKMAEKFGNIKIGGKGKRHITFILTKYNQHLINIK